MGKMLVGLISMAFAAHASASIELTDLAGVTASAGSCYLGCGNSSYDASNIIDGDYGATGNTGLNAWNAGGFSGYVQLDFGSTYFLDRIELYGGYPYANNFTLLTSIDGVAWQSVTNGSFNLTPALTHSGWDYLPSDGQDTSKYGAVFNLSPDTVSARYLRYSSGGERQWAYLFEMDVLGHSAMVSSPVPEPESIGMLLTGLFAVGRVARRHNKVAYK